MGEAHASEGGGAGEAGSDFLTEFRFIVCFGTAEAPKAPTLPRARGNVGASASVASPGSVESPDLERSRRGVALDLVLDGHGFEARLEHRGILRSRLSSGLHDTEIGDRVVGTVIPAQHDLG